MKDEFKLELFKIHASEEELRDVAGVAKRYGWVAEPDDAGGEWSLTESGARLPQPTSLATAQVVGRIAHVANPVREQAATFLPLIALVAGGVAAVAADVTTLTVVRVIAIVVLAYVFAVQLAGEAAIIEAVKLWPRLSQSHEQVTHKAVLRFYDWPRFFINVGFLVATAASFGLGIFNQPVACGIAVGIAAILGLRVLVWSLLCEREVQRHRRDASSA
jgi:hypothetical protein